MAITLVLGQIVQAEGSGTTVTATLPNNPAVGNLVIAVVSAGGNQTFSVKDGATSPNSYTPTTSTPFFAGGAINATTGIFYFIATSTANKAVTLTYSVSTTADIFVAEFTGNIAIPFEADATNSTTVASTAVNLPSITTANNGDLLIANASVTGVIASANSPWTGWAGGVAASGNYAAYYIQPTAGAQAVNFTTSSGEYNAMEAAFLAGSATQYLRRAPRIKLPFVWPKLPVPEQAYNLNLYTPAVQAPFSYSDIFPVRRQIAPPWLDQQFNQNLFTNPIPFSQNASNGAFFDRATPAPDQIYNPNILTNPFPFSQNVSNGAFFDRATPAPDQIYNPNLYTVTVVALPFTQTTLPPPFAVPLAPVDFFNMVLLAQAPTALPFIPTDVLKPFVPRYPLPLDQALNINLFTNPIPFAQYDWAKPVRIPHAPPDLSVQLNPNLFTNPFPFSQGYSNSLFWDRITPSPDQIYNPNLYSVVVVSNPFNQTDWSKSFALRPVSPLDQALNINLFTNPIPFNQIDWSKPVRSPRASVQPPDTLNPNIFTNPIPFNQVDWSKPVRILLAQLDQQPLNLNLFTLIAPLPFNQTDWAKPITVPRAPYHQLPLNLNLFTNPIPFMVTDRLPNVRLPLVLPQPPLPLNLNLFKNPVPFNQVDWAKPFRVRGYPNHTLPQNLNLLSHIIYLASMNAVEHGDFLLAVLYQFNVPLSAYVGIIENLDQSSIVGIPPEFGVAGARVAIITGT